MAYYTVTRQQDGTRLKKCQGCKTLNHFGRRNCRHCSERLARAPRKAKPRRGSMERVALELRGAQALVDQWAGRAAAAVARLRYYNRRERALAARLAAGPQPPRPKRERPPTRGIALRGLAPAKVQA